MKGSAWITVASFARGLFVLMCVAAIALLSTSTAAGEGVDPLLRKLMAWHGVEPLDPGPAQDPARVQLGQALFFDRELSGNRDMACATCHHPFLATGDGLALPVGTGALNPGSIGLDRIKGPDREFVPRNAPEVFDRMSPLWRTQFWDGRIEQLPDGTLITPAGDSLLPGLETVLAAQAMFPVTSRDEMRGLAGDVDVFGQPNEIALVANSDFRGIWAALMNRLLAIEEYERLFAAAYPDKEPDELTFADAATAIAAFEAEAYTLLESPWDRYVAGDSSALTPQQKRGALLFYGRARCASCHRGPLLTDQQYYNIGVPQLGPGKAPYQPLDLGRFAETLDRKDLFAFQTSPLRNVAETGPWMHNGAFSDLGDVIRHHANPVKSLTGYDPERQLAQVELRETVRNDPLTATLLLVNLDWQVMPFLLFDEEIEDLEAFLHALTADNFADRLLATLPASVPSGLPVDPSD